jgi:phage regulator Rha-like protein
MMLLAKQTMTSREIAELTGKQHAHVMEAIRNMEDAWVKVSQSKFRLAEYIDTRGLEQTDYQVRPFG